MSTGKFVKQAGAVTDTLDWGTMTWLSRPELTGSDYIVEIIVVIQPGFGHDFHIHPNQEETIYVLEGEAQQWLEKEHTTLKAGDAVYIPKGMVHATFNVSDKAVKLHVTLGPSVGDEGYELVEVHEEAPWNSLRS